MRCPDTVISPLTLISFVFGCCSEVLVTLNQVEREANYVSSKHGGAYDGKRRCRFNHLLTLQDEQEQPARPQEGGLSTGTRYQVALLSGFWVEHIRISK